MKKASSEKIIRLPKMIACLTCIYYCPRQGRIFLSSVSSYLLTFTNLKAFARCALLIEVLESQKFWGSKQMAKRALASPMFGFKMLQDDWGDQKCSELR